ncbi:phasin family protein [Novosphingobium sp. JCM 18896]|uniref:phasin family protein n=1 Tax=Novosphingobium sp. JCM 18896 TaxID=2989731 RepID=UPI002222731C|nr:TIGR01841 family phasin [Novosphingobium sp. JCM 18896]MCW1428692.1 TIGR01841 family phasin [Novosphingobium sp. JCM 18896]
MADSDETKAEASAEKAYAAASEAVGEKIAPESPLETVAVPEQVVPEAVAPAETSIAPVEFPAKSKRERKPRPAAVVTPEPVEAAAPPALVKSAAKPARPRAPASKTIRATKSVAKPAPKPAIKRAAAKAAAPKPKPVVAKTAKPAKAPVRPAVKPSTPFLAQLKEIPMDVTASIKEAVNGAQEKAKDAFAKTSAAASEYGEFAKGNVEAFVESGKILASGLQEMGNTFVADSKAAFETATADVKAFAAIKSPTDLFKLQTELLRRNFDTAVAYSTKTGEAVAKLTNDAFAPISGRVSLAVEKLKKAA